MKITKIISVIAIASTMVLAGPVLIVNPANSSSGLSKSEIKRVLKGKTKKLGGQKVVLINNGDASVADPFLDGTVGMSGAEFKKFWLDQQIKGKGTAPMIQKTSAAVKLMVSQIPGAVGFVDESVVDASVKVVKVK